MAKYFFDLETDHHRVIDVHGEELAGLSEARQEAIRYAIEQARNTVLDASLTEVKVVVRDSIGDEPLSVAFCVLPQQRTAE